MWYFAWILGMPLACCLAILNAMWLELRSDDERNEQQRIHRT
ncbi:cytochrome bd-I oxidase subunit CydX [uncultured Roseibium sp.]|nr:cytochrome bd-I oxidase subunit CydX [uncultured Roseibium sp.]